jgi:hypothetical protein
MSPLGGPCPGWAKWPLTPAGKTGFNVAGRPVAVDLIIFIMKVKVIHSHVKGESVYSCVYASSDENQEKKALWNCI